jgi:colanic acid/amylovoran biosynthesis protein
MKIIITGVTGLRNRGVEALVRTKIEQIKYRVPDCEIVVLSSTPDYDQLRLQMDKVRFIVDPFRAIYGRVVQKLETVKSLLKYLGNDAGRAVREYDAVVEEIKSASLVIASGGDIFSRTYSNETTNTFRLHLKPLEIAQQHKVPVVFLSHSIGKFKSLGEAEPWLEVAKNSPLLTIRESVTYEHVINDLHLDKKTAHLTADSAFLLQPIGSADIAKLRHYYHLDNASSTIALSISQGISRFAQVNTISHASSWHNIISMLLEKTNAQIILIPHVQELIAANNDALIGTELIRSFNFDPRVQLISADHSASEYKGLISSCDFLVAERMHAAIGGLSSQIPTMAIGYSPKAEGILKDLYGKNVQQTLIPIQELLNTNKAFQNIYANWENRASLKSLLQTNLPSIIERSKKNFDLLSDLNLVGQPS